MNLILAGEGTKASNPNTAQCSAATADGEVAQRQIEGNSQFRDFCAEPNKQLSILIHKALETLKASNTQAFDSIKCDLLDLELAQQVATGTPKEQPTLEDLEILAN